MTTKLNRRAILAGTVAMGGAMGAGLLAPGRARAQAFPTHPITLVVGGAPGSVPDVLARLAAQHLGNQLGPNVVVENRPGAGGITAMQRLTRASADGHTLGLVTLSQAVFNAYLFANLPYDPRKDITPVARLSTSCMAIAAHPSLGASTLVELAAKARALPGKLFIGTAPVGSPPHLVALLVQRALGIEATMVPFTTGPDGLQALLRNDIQVSIDGPAIIAPHAKAGAIKVLSVTNATRVPALPEAPTIAQAGFPAGQAETWLGLAAPAGTNPAVVAKLNDAANALRTVPEFSTRLAELGFAPAQGSPADFAAAIAADHTRWGGLIRDAGIRIE